MSNTPTELSIRLSLALKKVHKRDRTAFAHKDWKIREEAEQAIAALLEAELDCYDFTLKPVSLSNTHQGHASSCTQRAIEDVSKAAQKELWATDETVERRE